MLSLTKPLLAIIFFFFSVVLLSSVGFIYYNAVPVVSDELVPSTEQIERLLSKSVTISEAEEQQLRDDISAVKASQTYYESETKKIADAKEQAQMLPPKILYSAVVTGYYSCPYSDGTAEYSVAVYHNEAKSLPEKTVANGSATYACNIVKLKVWTADASFDVVPQVTGPTKNLNVYVHDLNSSEGSVVQVLQTV